MGYYHNQTITHYIFKLNALEMLSKNNKFTIEELMSEIFSKVFLGLKVGGLAVNSWAVENL